MAFFRFRSFCLHSLHRASPSFCGARPRACACACSAPIRSAADFAGVPGKKLIIQIYAIAGFIAALAGLVVLARVNSANADYGSSYLLLVILINILAGVSPAGGFGTVTGVVLAVICLQFISSGLNILSFSAFSRDLFFGGLLIAVMSYRAAFGSFDVKALFQRKAHQP